MPARIDECDDSSRNESPIHSVTRLYRSEFPKIEITNFFVLSHSDCAILSDMLLLNLRDIEGFAREIRLAH